MKASYIIKSHKWGKTQYLKAKILSDLKDKLLLKRLLEIKDIDIYNNELWC